MITQLTYHVPKTEKEVSEALAGSGSHPRMLAGGTDLVIRLNSGNLTITDLIDLNHLPELCNIKDLPDGGIRIGATVRLADLIKNPRIKNNYPALWEGAITVGSVQIRNRATLVGNICNASPAADTAPGLLVYGAIVNIRGPSRKRRLPIDEFFLGPGRTSLSRGEWVFSIDLPKVKDHRSCYIKLGRTLGVDLAIVGVALYYSATDVRLAYSSVGPTPVILKDVGQGFLSCTDEPELRQMIENTINSTLKPIDDIRASAEYRLAMAKVLTIRAWQRISLRLNSRP